MKQKKTVPVAIASHTYKIDGALLGQAEALALKRLDGTTRFVLLDAKVGDLPGTMVCKRDPTVRLHSLEAAKAAFEQRRRDEGHWDTRRGQATAFVARSKSGSSETASM